MNTEISPNDILTIIKFYQLKSWDNYKISVTATIV
jgi:hypothetical protein